MKKGLWGAALAACVGVCAAAGGAKAALLIDAGFVGLQETSEGFIQEYVSSTLDTSNFTLNYNYNVIYTYENLSPSPPDRVLQGSSHLTAYSYNISQSPYDNGLTRVEISFYSNPINEFLDFVLETGEVLGGSVYLAKAPQIASPLFYLRSQEIPQTVPLPNAALEFGASLVGLGGLGYLIRRRQAEKSHV